jgi:hypothetical protein
MTRSPATCGRGEHVGNISHSECLFSQPRGGREAGSGAAGWPRIADAAAIERGEEVDPARRLDPERPVGPIRVRLADWVERALRREQSVPVSRV